DASVPFVSDIVGHGAVDGCFEMIGDGRFAGDKSGVVDADVVDVALLDADVLTRVDLALRGQPVALPLEVGVQVWADAFLDAVRVARHPGLLHGQKSLLNRLP